MEFTGRNSPELLQNVVKTSQGFYFIGPLPIHTQRRAPSRKGNFLRKGITLIKEMLLCHVLLHFRYMCSLKEYMFIIITT
jgi:hypothetical protein